MIPLGSYGTPCMTLRASLGFEPDVAWLLGIFPIFYLKPVTYYDIG